MKNICILCEEYLHFEEIYINVKQLHIYVKSILSEVFRGEVPRVNLGLWEKEASSAILDVGLGSQSQIPLNFVIFFYYTFVYL